MMDDSLYLRMVCAKDDESFEDIFTSLGIFDGYKILLNVATNTLTRDKIIRYVAYAYSYASPAIRKSKDRTENKKAICKKVGLAISDPLIEEILKNKNADVNKYIGWWFEETAHPLWASYLNGMEVSSQLFEFARTGLEIEFSVSEAKMLRMILRNSKDAVKAKAEAQLNARKILSVAEEDYKELQKIYELPEKIMKDEVPEFFGGSRNMAEYLAKQNRNRNEGSRAKNHPALSEG